MREIIMERELSQNIIRAFIFNIAAVVFLSQHFGGGPCNIDPLILLIIPILLAGFIFSIAAIIKSFEEKRLRLTVAVNLIGFAIMIYLAFK